MFDDRGGEAINGQNIAAAIAMQAVLLVQYIQGKRAKTLHQILARCYVNGLFFPDHFLFAKHTL